MVNSNVVGIKWNRYLLSLEVISLSECQKRRELGISEIRYVVGRTYLKFTTEDYAETYQQ